MGLGISGGGFASGTSSTATYVATLRDSKAAGTLGGNTLTNGSWITRDLNAKDDPDAIVALAGNQFTLGAGRYAILASAPAHAVTAHKIRLRNITDGSTTAVGANAYALDNQATPSVLFCVITITGLKTFEIQHLITNDRGSGCNCGFGANGGETETYAEVQIIQVV